MLKKILIAAVALIIVVVVGVVALVAFGIDAGVKLAIEQGGTYALGVETKLDKADVGLLSGTFDMEGLSVANPQGYGASHFLTLGKGGIAVKPESVRQDVLEIPLLSLSTVGMSLEKKDGKANYQVILDNLKRFESAEEKPKDPAAEGPKFVIREIVIEDINVTVDLLPIGGSLTRTNVPIDRITLQNVGNAEGSSVDVAKLMDIVIKAILAAVVDKAGSILPGDIAGDLKNGLAGLGSLADAGIGVATDAGAALQGLIEGANLGEAAKGVGDAAKGVGDAAGGALEGIGKGIGGLLGGDKKKEGDGGQ